jgi:large repetitive protein
MTRKAFGLLLGILAVAMPALAQSPPFGAIDEPQAGQTVYGVVKVSGYVLSFDPVDKIEIVVDGLVQNRADINLPRADVLNVFPNYANSATPLPGYVSSFLARNFGNGPHSLAVRVTFSDGTQQNLATETILIDNTQNQPPFGSIDIPSDQAVEGANGPFPVSGWVLDDQGVDHIDISVDDQIVAGAVGCGPAGNYGGPSSARCGSTRPDVQAAFPDVPNSLYTGWQANIDATAFLDGLHSISVRATDNQGLSRVIGRRTIQIVENGYNLGPFGRIDTPLDESTLFGFCQQGGGFPSPCTPDICGSAENLVVVSGWALDTGSRLDKGQVKYVELLINGTIIANTETDCHQLALNLGGGYVDCYGINRPDVEQAYSGFVNSSNAGYVFAFDPAYLIASGYSVGKHTLAIRVGDEKDTVNVIQEISVNLACDQPGNNQASFGYIDYPFDDQFVGGTVNVFGWAYDYQLVKQVDVDVDGQIVGTAVYGLPRPDVPKGDPRVAYSNVGFSYLLDTATLSDGAHDINVYVTDKQSQRTLIGRRRIVVNNNVLSHN